MFLFLYFAQNIMTRFYINYIFITNNRKIEINYKIINYNKQMFLFLYFA